MTMSWRRVRLLMFVTRRARFLVTRPSGRVRLLMLMAWGRTRLVASRGRLGLVMVTVVV